MNLARCTTRFARLFAAGIDLLKIESRPIKGEPKHFNFYLDLSAPQSESELRGALEDIREIAVEVRNLGRYSRIA